MTSGPDPTELLAAVYGATAPAYARLWGPVIQPMGERLVAAMPLARATAILDVGSGSGGLLPILASAAPGAFIVGIDRVHAMLCLARSRFRATPLAVMDAAQLGLRSSTFDAALVAFVLFHLPDPVRALAELRHVVQPGGVVGTATWGPDQLLPASAVWAEELDAQGAKGEALPEAVQQHTLMDGPDKVGDLIRAAGLTPVRVWTERFERSWSWQELYVHRSGYGLYKRRLDTLDDARRQTGLERIRERLSRLAPAELVWRPDVIFAIARRS